MTFVQTRAADNSFRFFTQLPGDTVIMTGDYLPLGITGDPDNPVAVDPPGGPYIDIGFDFSALNIRTPNDKTQRLTGIVDGIHICEQGVIFKLKL